MWPKTRIPPPPVMQLNVQEGIIFAEEARRALSGQISNKRQLAISIHIAEVFLEKAKKAINQEGE